MVTAIETHYGGYRFRSRLEARWAVFFDTLGLRWGYEIEGFRIPTRIGTVNYLPDFYLPNSGQWVEVKGFLNMESVDRLCAIAEAMTECGEGNDLVVLGNVPGPHSLRWPVQLHFHENLWGVAWDPEPSRCPLNRPRVAIEPTERVAEALVSGFTFGTPDWARNGNIPYGGSGEYGAWEALQAARRARFEWGESG